jgi:hypothetical protein
VQPYFSPRPCTNRETLVFDHRRSGDSRFKDVEAGYGGKARFKERPARERNQGEGVQDLHRCGNGSGRREVTSELDVRARVCHINPKIQCLSIFSVRSTRFRGGSSEPLVVNWVRLPCLCLCYFCYDKSD